MKSLRDDFGVLRVDSMKLIREGALLGPCKQAKTRSSLVALSLESRSPSFLRVRKDLSLVFL